MPIQLLPEEIPKVADSEEQRVVNAYHRLFDGKDKDFEIVWNDLVRKFQMNKPAFIPERGIMCEKMAAYRSGAYAVLAHVSSRLLQKVQGDANVEGGKLTIKK